MKFPSIALTTLLVAVFSLFGCKGQPQWQNMNPDEFAQAIAGEKVQIVDVRTSKEYQQGHIENALNIDVTADTFDRQAEELLDTQRPIAVYCRSGNRSTKAIHRLAAAGYKTIYHLEGGIKSWTAAQKPVVQESEE